MSDNARVALRAAVAAVNNDAGRGIQDPAYYAAMTDRVLTTAEAFKRWLDDQDMGAS